MRNRGQAQLYLLALSAGILSFLAFPPVGLAPLVLVAPVPLLWALGREGGLGFRRAFLLGWLTSFTHFLGVLYWILSLPNEEVTIPGIMIPGLLFMSGYLAFFFGAASGVAVWISRRLALPLGIVWAVTVTLADWWRSVGELGFPWGAHAYALAHTVAWVQFTSATGFWGLVFWVALSGGLLYHLLLGWPAPRWRVGLLWGIVLLLPVAHGSLLLARAGRGGVDEAGGIRVAVIQPNTSREIKWDPRYREIVVNDLLARTLQAAKTEPDLIIWPETAAPILLLQEPVYLGRVLSTVRSLGIPLLAGTLDHRVEGGIAVSHNSAALFGAEGRVEDRYDKRRLVPFSERMPFQKALPWLSGLNFGQSDFTPGQRNVLFRVAGARIAPLICYESIFPELARSFSAGGANLLVNITNDFWFGDTAAPEQHADMAIFRAIETRTVLVRCANTGISMIVDRWGRVSHKTETFVEALIDVRVEPSAGKSFYVRHGEWFASGLLGLFGAMALAALFVPRRDA